MVRILYLGLHLHNATPGDVRPFHDPDSVVVHIARFHRCRLRLSVLLLILTKQLNVLHETDPVVPLHQAAENEQKR